MNDDCGKGETARMKALNVSDCEAKKRVPWTRLNKIEGDNEYDGKFRRERIV